ncbi:hypothetical protein AWJ20_2203 [Sugiyamaella lignohabitans]|uniref:Monooxygenase n=1 Tax=Sugiyamaella lignohabitans TaxID=796027 RepID=A0A167EY52_9ASCO|nr:uncharacterized protein AWJ20_2203 [Sugiyamaella lignohabitans]ANB14598.1 hypothetical protein AWJ20_2203 [Sugiyamaella lignohabitans]
MYPKIEGLDPDETKRTFQGVYAHSARWDPETPLEDKDVIVIGNGCSGAQIVPACAKTAKSVTQFFRAKHWLVPTPKMDPLKVRDKVNNVLGVRLSRMLLFLFLEAQFPMFSNDGYWANKVRDFNTNKARTHMLKTAPQKYHDMIMPDFKIGCKRRIIDYGYLQSLHNENVLLSDDPIVSVSEHHVHTKSGKSYHADVIFAATGFDVQSSSGNIPIYGLDKEENITEFWDRTGVSAYNVSQVAGYPNLFYLLGPNAGTGHTSALLQIENTLTYIDNVAGYVLRGEASSVDVKLTAYLEWKREINEASKQTVQMKGGCSSWYIKNGTNSVFYPWSQIRYWWRAVWPKYEDQTYRWTRNDVIQTKRRRRHTLLAVLLSIILKFTYFK